MQIMVNDCVKEKQIIDLDVKFTFSHSVLCFVSWVIDRKQNVTKTKHSASSVPKNTAAAHLLIEC